MEDQKLVNLLENTSNKPSKFRTTNRVDMNYDASGTYNTNRQIRFKTSMLKPSLCNYRDAYIPVSGTIKVAQVVASGGNNSIEVAFKNCSPFTDYISQIKNTQIDNA